MVRLTLGAGAFIVENLRGVGRFARFTGEILLSIGRLLTRRATFRSEDFWDLLWEASGRAFPIVFLITFLTGMIMAFVGAVQLQQFGADIFVANLVALAMFREMGAIMTAVIVAGRTGSAFASSIASMQASEEVDAIRTMGLSPFDFLVLPRLVALAVMLPFLSFLGSVIGTLGGLVVSSTMMNVTATQYITQSETALSAEDFASGIVKSVVFGLIIAVAGCYRGFHAARNAEGVGRAATSSVVSAITWIVVADALFAVIFHLYGF